MNFPTTIFRNAAANFDWACRSASAYLRFLPLYRSSILRAYRNDWHFSIMSVNKLLHTFSTSNVHPPHPSHCSLPYDNVVRHDYSHTIPANGIRFVSGFECSSFCFDSHSKSMLHCQSKQHAHKSMIEHNKKMESERAGENSRTLARVRKNDN